MPTLLQRLASFWTPTRADAAPSPVPQLPGPPQLRADGGASVANPLTGLGGWSDKGTAARPNPWVFDLNFTELRALWRQNGLARKLVNILPRRACRRGWTVPDFQAEDTRLAVPVKCEQAMRWAQLYGGSLLVPITLDDVPPEYRSRPSLWLQQPLDPERVQQVQAVQVFDAVEISAAHWDRDPASHTFRLPDLWRISCQGWQITIHASRVVHFRGAERPPSEMQGGFGSNNGLPDDSFLQAIWDDVRHSAEISNAGAVLAQEIREKVLALDSLAELGVGDEGAKVEAQVSLMAQLGGLLGVNLISTKDRWENRSNPPTGFKDLSDGAWEMLAAVTDIPQAVLRGDAPSGLNTDGESGNENFRQLVSGYQEGQRYDLEKLYGILGAAQDGPTAGAGLEDRVLTFEPLDEPDQRDQAETRKIVAETDAIYINAGVYGPEDVAISRFGEEGYSFDLLPVEPPDPEEEAALEALRLQLETLQAAGAGGADPAADPAENDAPNDPHADAIDPDSVCVLIPAADSGLRSLVEAAIGQTLMPEDEPHVTLLYLGTGLTPEGIAEVVGVVTRESERAQAGTLANGTVRAFPHGADGTPVVVEFTDAWPAQGLHDTLLTQLAHLVTQRQHPRYRPHLTIGYAPEPLSVEALGALAGIDASEVRVPIAAVTVNVGGEIEALATTGAA